MAEVHEDTIRHGVEVFFEVWRKELARDEQGNPKLDEHNNPQYRTVVCKIDRRNPDEVHELIVHQFNQYLKGDFDNTPDMFFEHTRKKIEDWRSRLFPNRLVIGNPKRLHADFELYLKALSEFEKGQEFPVEQFTTVVQKVKLLDGLGVLAFLRKYERIGQNNSELGRLLATFIDSPSDQITRVLSALRNPKDKNSKAVQEKVDELVARYTKPLS